MSEKSLSYPVEITERGFEYIEFTDRYGEGCSLQQSSLAEFEIPGISAVWLGLSKHRMHLDRSQVAWLIKKLVLWLAIDSFEEGQESE